MAPARFTGFIPWNRLSKPKLLHGERQNSGGEQRGAMLSVIRIEVDAKSNFREIFEEWAGRGLVLV
jgi:hypothetical protein